MTPQNLFNDYLKKISLLAWGLRLAKIPFNLLTAKLTADTVSAATEGNLKNLWQSGALLLCIAIGIQLFNIVSETMYQKALSKSLHNCKQELYRQFLSSPLHVLFKSKHGDSMEMLNDDFNTMAKKSTELYPGFWTGIITVAVYFIFLSMQSLWIGLALLVISLLQVIPPIITKKFFQDNYSDNRDIEARLTDYIISGYRGFEEIKLYGLKKWWLSGLKKIHKKYMAVGSRSEATYTLDSSIGNLVDHILTYGTYVIIGLFVLFKYSSIEAGTQAITLSTSMFSSVKTIFSLIPDFSVAKIAQNRLGSWFTAHSNEKLIVNGEITLSDVRCLYEEKEIFSNISALLNGKKMTIIKGANGVGKSTLLRLITGHCLCDSGEIRIDGVSPLLLDGKNFPSKIFYLSQEDAVFNFTPHELYEIVLSFEALKAEKLAEKFLLAKEIIYNAKISEVSGGERKKVFLALAFAVNPILLLMDEPTNSLDAKGKDMLSFLLKERNGKTIIITHENIFDDLAENIYVLTNGRIDREKKR